MYVVSTLEMLQATWMDDKTFAIDFWFVFDEMENLSEIECVIERYKWNAIINQRYIAKTRIF